MIITIRVSEVDGALIKRYAEFNGESVSSLIKKLVLEQIEADYNKLMAEVEKKKD